MRSVERYSETNYDCTALVIAMWHLVTNVSIKLVIKSCASKWMLSQKCFYGPKTHFPTSTTTRVSPLRHHDEQNR